MNTDSIVFVQPPPHPEGELVLPHVLAALGNDEDMKALAVRRAEFGIAKYGQPLMTDDGRSTDIEIEQEIIDNMMYAMKGYLQNGHSFYKHMFNSARHQLRMIKIHQTGGYTDYPKHSPTPWALKFGLIVDADGTPIMDPSINHQQKHVNALLVVQGVNLLLAE